MKYLIANWKMNSVNLDIWEQEFIKIVNSQNNFPNSNELKLIVCLNLFDYHALSKRIKDSKNEIFNKISLYAQDVSQHDEGAFTGQISSKFLKTAGVEGSIIGHSELRENGDTESIVHKKGFKLKQQALSNIFCIGEGLEILENNKKKSFLLNQLQTFCKNNLSPDLLAYEPIWAIGTGKEADSENIASAVSIILDFFEDKKIDCPVLYGGSVSKRNIEEIIAIPGIEGCLVGNSSLDGEQFAIIASKIKS
jgi:triosephosphate isomerase